MVALVVLMAAAETLGVLSIMPFLTLLGRPEAVDDSPVLMAVYRWLGSESTRQFIASLGLASIAVVISSSAFKTMTLHMVNRFVYLERHSISARLLARYLHQPYEFFLTKNSAVLGKNVLSEADQLVFGMLQPLSQLIAQGMVVFAMALVIFVYDPLTATCIFVVLLSLYGVIYGLVRKRLVRIGRETQEANARRYQACNEALTGIKDVIAGHSQEEYLKRYSLASRIFSRHLATNETLTQSPMYIVEAIGYTGLIVISLVLLARSQNVADVVPALGLYGFAAYRMLPSAQVMYRGFAKLKFASAALDAISSELQLPSRGKATDSAALALNDRIRLDEILYAYPSTPERPVFDGFTMVIPANTSVGIVGRSGAGKSTLLDILLGLLHPQAGTLRIDDVEVTARNAGAWQRAIGYVPQQIHLSDASVAENIALGKPRGEIDIKAVERAARAAQIHEFIVSELPHGYDTSVGDRGIRLSGGQRQRIGIARALYRDPPVLLMDEATSALDPETEEAVNEAIRHLAGSKTIIVIAHKRSSLQHCDRIVDLTSGTSLPINGKAS
jgi:ABC-type multidrug transport system fused ATPase/permease subunit